MRRSAVWLLWTALALLPAALPAQTGVLVADVQPHHPAAASLEPQDLTPVARQLFFVDHDANLWVTDGTALGTRSLLSLCHPRCEGPGEEILGHDGRLLYAAAGENGTTQRLWRTDGTRPGTFPLGLPDLVLPVEFGERLLTAAAGRQFFFEGCTASAECGLGSSMAARPAPAPCWRAL